MVDTSIIAFLATSATAQVFLAGITVYFAVKITRAVGSFWAWTLIVVAFVLNTLRNVSSLALTVSLPPEQLAQLIEQLSWVAVWPSQVLNIAAAVLLAAGMFGLMRIFEKREAATSTVK